MALYAALLLIIGFIFLLLIVGMTFLLGRQAEADLDRAARARATSESAVSLAEGLQAAESSQRGYLLSDNPIYLAPYATAKAKVLRQKDMLAAALQTDLANIARAAKLAEILDEKLAEMDQTVSLKRMGKDAEVAAIVRSNKGKALMDEARIFLSSITRATDRQLTTAIAEQKQNLAFLRMSNLAAAFVVLLVVSGVYRLHFSYIRSLSRAQREVETLNAGLEQRVEERTTALTAARDRAEMLLAEVNHRVANSLSLVASMVGMQGRATRSDEARQVLNETQSRIQAVAMVHKTLYSSGDIHTVELSEFLSGLLAQLEMSLNGAGLNSKLTHDLSPVWMPTDKSVSVGVITAEWVTNAFKYAYPQGSGEIRVRLKRSDDGSMHLVVEDDGIGRSDEVAPKGTGLGTRLVNSMAASLGATVDYIARHPGTAARMTIQAG
ncbi:MAG: CHASE3 domain-containing protein [Candidatus Saccharibacteria bacterium]|nr:CHASE3 domain-containing protein [Pseudorhodobacter sp.]